MYRTVLPNNLHKVLYGRKKTCTHRHRHTHTHARMYAHAHTCSHTHTHTHTHKPQWIQTCMTLICMHKCMHTHTHTHTHTHAHTHYLKSLVSIFLRHRYEKVSVSREVPILLWIWALRDLAMSVHSSPMKSRKRLVPDVVYTLLHIPAWFIASYVNWWAQNSSAHMSCFCDFHQKTLLLFFLQKGQEVKWKTAVRHFKKKKNHCCFQDLWCFFTFILLYQTQVLMV